MPEENRLQELSVEKKIFEGEQGLCSSFLIFLFYLLEPATPVEFEDDGQPVDTYAMVSQMKEEMNEYRVTVSDYSRGSRVYVF